MPNKQYKTEDDAPYIVSEPAVAYRRDVARNVSTQNQWNPNVPFCGTQEEWWEHFHRIEAGEFMTLEEFNQRFETWWKTHIANKLK